MGSQALRKRKSSVLIDKTQSDYLDKAEGGGGAGGKATAEQEGHAAATSSPPHGWNAALSIPNERADPAIISAPDQPLNSNARSSGNRDLSAAKAWGTIKEAAPPPPPPPSAPPRSTMSAGGLLPAHLAAAEKGISGGFNRPSSGGRNRVAPEPALLTNDVTSGPNRLSPRSTAVASSASPVVANDQPNEHNEAFLAKVGSGGDDGQHFQLPGGFVSFKGGQSQLAADRAVQLAADRAVGSVIYSAEQREAKEGIVEEGEGEGEEEEEGKRSQDESCPMRGRVKLPALSKAPRYQAGHLPPLKKP